MDTTTKIAITYFTSTTFWGLRRRGTSEYSEAVTNEFDAYNSATGIGTSFLMCLVRERLAKW